MTPDWLNGRVKELGRSATDVEELGSGLTDVRRVMQMGAGVRFFE